SPQLTRTLRFLRDPVVIQTAIAVAAGVVETVGSLTQDVSEVRRLADELMHDMNEVAEGCAQGQIHLERWGHMPWHTPSTLELSIVWHQMVELGAFLEARDAQYLEELHSTDPHLPAFVMSRAAVAAMTNPMTNPMTRPEGATPSSGYPSQP